MAYSVLRMALGLARCDRTGSGVMRTAYGVVLLVLCASASPPVVSNVRFAQVGPDKVEITYDLSDPDGDNDFTVTFDVSTDGGGTWPIKPERWSGDAGPNVKAGKQKRISWDAFGECGRLVSNRVVVRVRADDGRMAKRAEPVVQPPSQPSTSSGMSYLRRNAQGYDEYLWLKDSSVMVRVPAGAFTMGSTERDEEKPPRSVYLDEYDIDKYEMTNRQYKRFCDATGRSYPPDPDFLSTGVYFTAYPDYPVVNVSWEDAKAYCTWAGKRLPTEAEWERAARGTDGRKYPWGNAEPNGSQCNYADVRSRLGWANTGVDDGFAQTAPVGSFLAGASPYGCMDMAGNVFEWTADWYDAGYYLFAPNTNPAGPASGTTRIFRGGGWFRAAWELHATLRCYAYTPDSRVRDLGFRSAASVASSNSLPKTDTPVSRGSNFMVAGPISQRSITKKLVPRYPKWALERRISGTVVVRIWADPSGKVKGAPTVESSSGYPDLDQVVVDALRGWEFAPLAAGTKVEDQWGVITFKFSLQ